MEVCKYKGCSKETALHCLMEHNWRSVKQRVCRKRWNKQRCKQGSGSHRTEIKKMSGASTKTGTHLPMSQMGRTKQEWKEAVKTVEMASGWLQTRERQPRKKDVSTGQGVVAQPWKSSKKQEGKWWLLGQKEEEVEGGRQQVPTGGRTLDCRKGNTNKGKEACAKKEGQRKEAKRVGIKVGTANITGAGSIKRLDKCLGEADFWCVQEVKLRTEDEIAEWQKALQWLGFKSEVAPCFEGVKGNKKTRSSGVAMVWKPWIDIIVKPEVLVEARLQFTAIKHTKFGAFYLYNVYAPQGGTLKCQALYDVIARHVEGHGKPFVITGDHNNKREEVQHMWKESEAKRDMVVIDTKEPTCKTANGDSTVDFFVVDTLLAQATGAITLLDLHALKTHTRCLWHSQRRLWNKRSRFSRR